MPQRRHRAPTINLLPSSGLNHHFLSPDSIHPVSSDSGTSTSHGSRSIESKQGESALSSKGGGINFRGFQKWRRCQRTKWTELGQWRGIKRQNSIRNIIFSFDCWIISADRLDDVTFNLFLSMTAEDSVLKTGILKYISSKICIHHVSSFLLHFFFGATHMRNCFGMDPKSKLWLQGQI